MTTFADVRTRHIGLMQLTVTTLGHVLHDLTPEHATTLRDGPDGWTVLEVVCHLRDFDVIFQQRVHMILEQDSPALTGYDPDTLARERGYNQQQLAQVYEQLRQSRQQFVALFEGLSEAQWERAGVHPQRGHFTLTDAVMQVGLHDVVHLEQITRILTQRG